jgi:predicted MPP superfamily phosphohydrolase
MVSRRSFLLAGALGGVTAAGLTIFEAYAARYVNPYRPILEQISIPVPAGHEGLTGMRIGFMADTHVGPFITADDLRRATALISEQHPDLVLLGGDYVSESARYTSAAVEVIANLVHTTRLGGYAVLGNHDLSVSRTRVAEGLVAAGVPILRNDSVSVPFGGGELWLAGIDETLHGNPDVDATFAQIPAGAASIALWHEPQFAEQAAAQGAFLQLSGHTHGGQVRLPGVGPVGLPVHGKRYVMGLDQIGAMSIYTARGVGVYRPPLRFNCPPEVTIVTLTESGTKPIE